jgi:hypothetical protein
MDYSVEWLIENEVVLVTQYQEFTIDIGAAMVRDASALMNTSSKAKVPFVVDARRVPGRIYNVFEALKMFRDNRTDKWGFTIAIGDKNAVQFVVQSVMQLTRIELRFAKDIDEALEILYRIDPTLPRKSDG